MERPHETHCLVPRLKGMWNSSEFERMNCAVSGSMYVGSLKGMWNSSEFERMNCAVSGSMYVGSLKGMWNSSEFESFVTFSSPQG